MQNAKKQLSPTIDTKFPICLYILSICDLRDECRHLKTGNCLTTNGNEEIFDIEGLTYYPKQKTKTYRVMGSSKQLPELKTELSS